MESIPERGRDMQGMWLRGPYAEDLEPALESCVKYEMMQLTKAQRRTGVNGFEPDAVKASIRVVPPNLRSLCRERRFSLCPRISRVRKADL